MLFQPDELGLEKEGGREVIPSRLEGLLEEPPVLRAGSRTPAEKKTQLLSGQSVSLHGSPDLSLHPEFRLP